ncbi:hypothetical protein, partial [Klebsiella pneumoniae]|uniref:hypothetical protein n=2 Tax=Pseudomonadota TaxID=1224 RepID=UPI001BCCAAD5
GIPLFWLCLFTGTDIKIAPGSENYVADADGDAIDEDFDEASLSTQDGEDGYRPYAFISCLKADGIDRLKQRSEILLASLGAERHRLYLEWIARMEAEPFRNILIKTEEIDGMGSDGELEALLRCAMRDLEAAMQSGVLVPSSELNNMMGLQEGSVLSECESFELAGCANSTQQWPQRLSATQREQADVLVPQIKKPKWMFWRR